MFKNKRFSLLLSGTVLCALSVALASVASAAPEPATFMRDVQPAFRTDEIPVIRKDSPLFNYSTEGAIEQIKMTGIYNERSFRFYSAKNELISKASVTLRYTPSPALIPQQSQLNVYLNGQLQKSLPITKDQLGNQVSATVDLNAKQFDSSNRLTLEFVGQYTQICGSPANPALWLTVDSSSYLSLNTQKLRLANDLSILPAPFVNTISPSATTLPMVFASTPDNRFKEAAAVLASWAGVRSEWRGIEFPVYYNEQPAEQNYVAFVTNDSRPDFLKFLPRVEAPTISIVNAPNSLYAKVLVIAGRNADDLLTAARYLATADAGIAGGMVTIENFKGEPDRKAYDAPSWVNTDQKIPFEKLSKYRGQLTSTGLHPAPIKLDVRLPPDLFMVNRSNVNLDLRYRYTRPMGGEPAQMRFLLNDQLVESYDLSPTKTSNSFMSQFSFINGLANLWNNTSIPSRLLSAENQLTFDFQYGLAVSGYPFTKYADLSQTLVLMKKDAPANVMTTMLNTMGRFGAQTGAPVTKVTFDSAIQNDNAQHRDILVFAENSADIDNLGKLEPEIILEKVKGNLKSNFEAKSKDAAPQSTVTEDTGIATIAQYESPYGSGRSVVAILGDGQDGSYLLNKRLMNPGDLKMVGGGVAIFKPNAQPASYMVGPDYYTGSLPWHQRVWYSLLDQPLLLVLFTLVCALLFAGGIYYLMHSLIRFRNRRN